MHVTYWTTASLEPGHEAVSKELFELSRRFPNCRIVATSPHLGFRFSRRPWVFGLNSRFDPLLRLAMPPLEQLTDINHIYGEVSPWPFSHRLRGRPTVLTIASEKGSIAEDFFDRLDAVTVQTGPMLERVRSVERWRAKVSLIYPGVDLCRYKPAELLQPQSGIRTKILLATFPRGANELQIRGVDLLFRLAASCPEVDFHLLPRPWASGDTASEVVRRRLECGAPPNLRLLDARQGAMEHLYPQYHFTIIPYETADGGKECPLSLVEGLACGIPVLISRAASFSEFVTRSGCGVAFDIEPHSFKLALDEAQSRYSSMRTCARDVACAHFDAEATAASFAKLYARLLKPKGPLRALPHEQR